MGNCQDATTYCQPEENAGNTSGLKFKIGRESRYDTGQTLPKSTIDHAKINSLMTMPAIKYEDRSVYQGEVVAEDVRHGFGRLRWPDGSEYIGEWRQNKACGFGRLVHIDGDCYEGYWVDDKAHGEGKFQKADGTVWEGHWENDQPHGFGVEKGSDGSTYIGQFAFGLREGVGKIISKDGSIFKVV